jgi:hypothetical protein
MNTKLLMTFSSLALGLAGILALFAPALLLVWLGAPVVPQLLIVVQLLGALYFSIALMNWTAKDSHIGGVYARPVSLANFGHFFMGTLLLAKYQLANQINISVLLALIVYTIFASLFYWLVFHATGITADKL